MVSLESDKMTAFWPNASITFTFYVTLSNGIPHWPIFDSGLRSESDEMNADDN